MLFTEKDNLNSKLHYITYYLLLLLYFLYFNRFKSFSENEYIAQLIGYEPSKSIAVLTTNNKIWTYRFGQESMIELVPLKVIYI